MVSRAALKCGLSFVAFVTFAATGQAQTLQRLTVQSFALSADTTRPRIDVPFQLIVTLRVRERVTQIENIELPILAELELLGDERQTATDPQGTQYRETITVVAHHAGGIAIGPATLQAIDARDGKPKQWYTNPLTLQIGGVEARAFREGAHALLAAALVALRVLLLLIGVGCVVVVLVLLFRRRRRPVAIVVAPVPPAAPPVVQRSRRKQFEDALTVLRTERTRASAVRVRAAVWRMLGASDGETLGDVLRRPEANEDSMRDLLIALERSAFTYDEDLRAAIDDACSSMERYLGSLV
jgi:hypothetical protein